jgi:hypothetical protein
MIMATQWILSMSNVNHDYGGRLVRSFQGSKRRWRKGRYMKWAEVKEGRFWAKNG